MLSNCFMNGIGDAVYIMDDQFDPNLFQVLPDYMNNLSQRRYQQPPMRPDVVRQEGMDYEYIPTTEFNPAYHPDGCQCEGCRRRRATDHVMIYQDLGYLQNAERQFVIDLHTYAFDTQSTMDYNRTMTQLRIYNHDSIPVFSKKYMVRILYTIISTDECGSMITAQDGAIQSEAKRHFYMTNDQTAEGFFTYQFMDLHNTDVIVIPTMYGAASITLNIRGIEVYAKTTGYSLTKQPDGRFIYTNTGVKDELIYQDLFGVEYRGYAYPVEPHDRVRINFSTVFNNVTFISDLNKLVDLKDGLDYRTCDFDTVPSWEGIQLWTGTNVTGDNFIHTTNDSYLDELDEILGDIPTPNLSEGEYQYAV